MILRFIILLRIISKSIPSNRAIQKLNQIITVKKTIAISLVSNKLFDDCTRNYGKV